MEELENNIIKQLTHYQSCWRGLTNPSNDGLNSRIIAMQIAINIVKKEFEKIKE